jgi:hypothetical protein
LRKWLQQNENGDAQSDLRLQYLLDRLREDKLIVACGRVRGQVRADQRRVLCRLRNRILPSSAGRTTRAPPSCNGRKATARDPPAAHREPQDQRQHHELKRYADEWQIRPSTPARPRASSRPLAQVGERRMASLTEAESWAS